MTMTAIPSVPILVGKWRVLCLFLAWIATFGLLFEPVFTVMAVLFSELLPPLKLSTSIPYSGDAPMTFRLGILACAALPAGLGMWASWSMRQLFLGFTRGEVFTAAALRHLQHIALALLLGEIAGVLVFAPETLLATWNLGHGKRAISLGVGSDDVLGLFLAGVAFVIARIMADASAIAADHAEIV